MVVPQAAAVCVCVCRSSRCADVTGGFAVRAATPSAFRATHHHFFFFFFSPSVSVDVPAPYVSGTNDRVYGYGRACTHVRVRACFTKLAAAAAH